MDQHRTNTRGKYQLVRVMNIVRIAVLAVALVLFAIFLFGLNAPSDITVGKIEQGAKYQFVVLSDSMHPDISAGDLITVQNVSASDIAIGDVITFFSEDTSNYGVKVTHKVVDIKETDDQYTYTTANAEGTQDDATVGDDRVIGKVVKVTRNLGHFVQFMQGPAGYICFVLIPLASLIVLQLLYVVKKFRDISRANTVIQQELADENDKLQQDLQLLRQQLADQQNNIVEVSCQEDSSIDD